MLSKISVRDLGCKPQLSIR